MEANKTEALAKRTEPRIEVVPNGVGGEKSVARAANGKFVKRATALAAENAKRVGKVMYTPDENGKTRLERILEAQAQVAEGNTDPRNLGQISSFIETADSISGQAMIRSKMSKEPDATNPIKVILISPPQLMHSDAKEDHAAPKPPAFLDAEIISTNDQS
jgi:hypothetical protein